jgi:glycosyltransferase involved in cell wall biosynthesis
VTPALPDSPSDACDVTVVVTGHGEGDGCRATFAALARGVEAAAQAGLVIEVLGVLDRADEATSAAFDDALGGAGALARLASGRVVVTDHGDPGAARNEGVRLARGAWVCLLDADNLPSRSWLRDAYAVATTHGSPCVVHPGLLVIFGERWEVWPQLPTDHPGFRPHNFFDRTYWDTFCLAERSVLEQHPYAATSAADGLGPEDWHWGMETVHAGIPHLVAPGTALFYRAKANGSVQGAHEESHSLLPPSALLTDGGLAQSCERVEDCAPTTWRGLQDLILRDNRGETVRAAVPEPAPGGWRGRRDTWPDHVRFLRSEAAGQSDRHVRQLVERTGFVGPPRRARLSEDELASIRDPGFNVLHYRALNSEALQLLEGEAVEHFLDVGRATHLRTALSEDELHDLAVLDLHDYRNLHADLAALDVDSLLHHYLAHGRAEGRAGSRTAEERQAAEPVVLSPALRAELEVMHDLDPTVPAPTAQNLGALRQVGPPLDGSLTAGSRAWWQVVDALGAPRPDRLVLTSGARGLEVRSDDDPPLDLTSLAGWSRLRDGERWRLIATLVVQYQPAAVHGIDAPELAEVVRHYGRALRASARLAASDAGGD